MNNTNFKLKILYVMQIMKEESDEDHPLTATDIIKRLKSYGTDASRRSVYDDIDILLQYGLDIVRVDGNRGWYLASRDFELVEIKLLIDAVKIAKFISSKKTEVLVKKLEQLASKNRARELNSHVMLDTQKSNNKMIYYSIDTINNAINADKRIEFQYGQWNIKKQYQLRRNGKVYSVSPWCVLWRKEQYYMLAYDDDISGIKHFRVDHIRGAKIVENSKRNGKEYYQKYKEKFVSKTFGMYGGVDTYVELICHNILVNKMIDQFGEDVCLIPNNENTFKIRALVSVGPQFYGWLTSFGSKIELISPKETKEEYKQFLKDVIGVYNSEG